MEYQKALLELTHLKGKSKKKISPEVYEAARKKAFEELEKSPLHQIDPF